MQRYAQMFFLYLTIQNMHKNGQKIFAADLH